MIGHPNDQAKKPHSQVSQTYPGPFCYREASDGVDSTFDIVCEQTGKHIASTFFWDERLPCELEARVIAELLNTLVDNACDDDGRNQLCDRELDAFRGMHPDPYRSEKTHCDYRGAGYEVLSAATGHCVIFVYDREFRGQARLVTFQIAELLNGTLLSK